MTVAKANENLSPNSNVAIWELVFLDHDATEEELTKIKNYFVKTYPWLFPDQAWTVVGKNNEDSDRATIANITGNGNNLVLSNFGFAENSGYGLYQVNWNASPWLIGSSRFQGSISSDKIVLQGTKENTNLWFIECTKDGIANDCYVKVSGIAELHNQLPDVNVVYSYFEGSVAKEVILSDGVVFLKGGITSVGNFLPRMGFSNKMPLNTTLNTPIVIEQIPEYEGYLVTDGVDDKIISSNFKFGENYTVVGEWEFLQEASNVSAGFVKNPNYWILYNYKDGIIAYIKADAQGSLISGVRSIKASTSKGDIYPDFNSYVKIEPGKRIESQYALNIAVNGNIFTKLAFKNLAIYPRILSKEDCIKAYNYLQTLKAK